MNTTRPDYHNPPVVETVLGIQFERLAGFTNGHLGAFWKTLDTQEWCSVRDQPPLAPQFERFDSSARWAKSVQFQLTQDPTCRLQIKNQPGDRMIQLQNNRLHFNWLGESGGCYPRYETVLEGFHNTLKRFISFIEQEGLGPFQPNQWEVTYVNHIPKGTVWNTPNDWSFFRLLSNSCLGNLHEEGFSGEWHFVIPERRGRLHVQWIYGLKGDEEEIVRLTLTARGSIGVDEHEDAKQPPIMQGLDLGRNTIVTSFRDLMSDQANDFWGLKNAANTNE